MQSLPNKTPGLINPRLMNIMRMTVGLIRKLLLASLAATVSAIAMAAVPTTPGAPLRAASPANPVKPANAVYIVQLKQPAASTYSGGVSGFAPIRTSGQSKISRSDVNVDGYATYLKGVQDNVLASVGATGSKIHSYSYALNGFAAQLSASQVSALARHPQVARLWLDTDQQLQTNNSDIFLGLLDREGGLRADLDLRGEGVVIGVIDSGIAANHPQLADILERVPRTCRSDWARASLLGRWLCESHWNNPETESLYDPVEGFTGTCQAGEGFTVDDCNNKIVGARYYVDGFLARHTLDDGEFLSPKDADGHGTHIATTIAGNLATATLFGTRIAEINGIAPRARIAVYKACWLKPDDTRATCTTADLARAIDDAVADGVDIINYSVGSLETDLTAPDDMALLNALNAGVLSVVAAGNDGPEPGTIGSPSSAPWVLTVGASTQTGMNYLEAIELTQPSELAGNLPMLEANFTPQLVNMEAIVADVVLVDDGQAALAGGGLGSEADACEALENASALDGNIALIERGGCDFQVKIGRVEDAGAVGAIVYNNSGAPFVMNGDTGSVNIPAVMIGSADGGAIRDSLAAEDTVTAKLEKGTFIERRTNGYQMAEFSSRGPSLSEWDFIKPDVTAPGVDILAGHTSEVANGLRGQLYQYLSGTSMSAPETAGVAALLKEANPDWTAGELKSALVTTARQIVVNHDLESDASPFDAGAGHIDANAAIDPGLAFDTEFLDHAAYLCGFDEQPFLQTDCDILELGGYSFTARELNLPSIGVSELITGDEITRVVKNMDDESATYSPTITEPFGIDVSVSPSSLSLSPGESGEFTLSFNAVNPQLDEWSFGELDWSDGTHVVQSPIAVRPVMLRAPTELDLVGASGDGTFPVDFGYSGNYLPNVFGLNAPFYLAEDEYVAEDSSNTFSFREGDGVAQHWFLVEPGDIYLRVSLFDEFTDGEDDLDLYLYYCATETSCVQVAESGSFTSEEEIDLLYPLPGQYTALVHGYETDPVAGGAGAVYSLFAWAFGVGEPDADVTVTVPDSVVNGDRLDFGIEWSGVEAGTRYFGGVVHGTPLDANYAITLLNAFDF